MVVVSVLPAALAAHRLWDLHDAFDDRPAQAREAGTPLLGEVRVVGGHLLGLVDLQLDIQLLQFVLVSAKSGGCRVFTGRWVARIEGKDREGETCQ